jgi:DNA polymerase III subunit delta
MAKTKKEKINVTELVDAFRQGKFAPLYFFYGEEDYPIDEVVDALVETAVPADLRAFNMDILQGDETDGRTVAALALSFPMISERRLIIVKDVDHLKEAETLESYIEAPSDKTVLVLVGTKPDMRKKPYPALKKQAVVGESPRLYDNEVPAWILRHARHLGVSLTNDAADLLQAYVGNSLRELANQMEKLVIAAGTRTTIERADVESVVGISKEFSIFELTRALGGQNPSKALSIAQHMLEAGEGIPFIVVMLTRHFTVLWKLLSLRGERKSEFELAQSVHINPYHLKEYNEQLRRFSATAIENAFLALTRADVEKKTSAADDHLILDMLICDIMRQPQ